MNKILQLYAKIEDLINLVLIKIISLLLAVVSKFIPAPLKRCFNSLSANIQAAQDKLIYKRIHYQNQMRNQFSILKEQSVKKVQELKEVPYKEIVRENKNQFIDALKKYSIKQWPQILGAYLLQNWQTLRLKHSWLSTGFIAYFTMSCAALAFIGYFALQSFESLSNKAGWRAPASIQEQEFQFYRPPYYKEELKQLRYERLELPVYVNDVNSLRKMHLEFVVTFSNRSAKQKLSTRLLDARIRDRISANLEYVIPTFPLTEEGKLMIKEKLIHEFNQFMIENNITEGTVADLRLVSVLSY